MEPLANRTLVGSRPPVITIIHMLPSHTYVTTAAAATRAQTLGQTVEHPAQERQRAHL